MDVPAPRAACKLFTAREEERVSWSSLPRTTSHSDSTSDGTNPASSSSTPGYSAPRDRVPEMTGGGRQGQIFASVARRELAYHSCDLGEEGEVWDWRGGDAALGVAEER